MVTEDAAAGDPMLANTSAEEVPTSSANAAQAALDGESIEMVEVYDEEGRSVLMTLEEYQNTFVAFTFSFTETIANRFCRYGESALIEAGVIDPNQIQHGHDVQPSEMLNDEATLFTQGSQHDPFEDSQPVQLTRCIQWS